MQEAGPSDSSSTLPLDHKNHHQTRSAGTKKTKNIVTNRQPDNTGTYLPDPPALPPALSAADGEEEHDEDEEPRGSRTRRCGPFPTGVQGRGPLPPAAASAPSPLALSPLPPPPTAAEDKDDAPLLAVVKEEEA